MPKKFIEPLFTDSLLKWISRIMLIFVVTTAIFLGLKWATLPPVVPFFYSLPWGEDQLGTPFFLLIAFIGGFLVYILMLTLGLLLFKKTTYFARLLITGSTITYFLLLITIVRILFLIT